MELYLHCPIHHDVMFKHRNYFAFYFIPQILLEGLRITTRNIDQNGWSPSRDFEAEALSIGPNSVL
jgi:hypothetical protein